MTIKAEEKYFEIILMSYLAQVRIYLREGRGGGNMNLTNVLFMTPSGIIITVDGYKNFF